MQVRIIDFNQSYKFQNAVNLLPFGQIGCVNFKNQLNGKGKELIILGKLSEKLGGITFVSAESDNCGLKRKSVFVFEGGKLKAICDMNAQEEKYSPSHGYKIFDFCSKKIGVIVDRDLYSPTAVSSLVNCGVGLIVNLFDGKIAKKAVVASEFYSYVYGVDFVCVGCDNQVAFNAYGEQVEFENRKVEMQFEGVYREVRQKRRGV